MSASTSPDNITYPISTDAFGPLETSFATLATSVQTALNGLKTYRTADHISLAAITGMATGALATVIEGGAIFDYNGTIWVQSTPATFATNTARDTAYAKATGAYRVLNAQVMRTDKGRTEQYFTAVTAGKTTAGWYQISGNPEVGVFAYNTGYSDNGATAITTIEKSNGFVTIIISGTKSSAVISGDLIGTLPLGFRPRTSQSRVDFAGGSNTGSIQNYIARDNGQINVYNPVSSPSGVFGSATFKALDAPVFD